MEQTALTYLCPDCMAYLRYDGKEQKWVCDYCGGKFTREELEQRGAETKQDDEAASLHAGAAFPKKEEGNTDLWQTAYETELLLLYAGIPAA